METRKYYNRYQRTMPIQQQRQNIIVNDDNNCSTNCNTNCTSLAMVYAPVQCFEDLYDLSSALSYGTIFKELNMPFTGKRC